MHFKTQKSASSLRIPVIGSKTLQNIPERNLGIVPPRIVLKPVGQANLPDDRPRKRAASREGKATVRNP
jgi:hypothetical protein